MAKTKKKNIKEIEIEEVEEIEEFDDEEFDLDDEVINEDTSVVDEFEEEFEPLTVEERIISIEKKTNTTMIFAIIAALFALLTFITNISSGDRSTNTTNNTGSETTASYDTSKFTEIKAQDIEAKSKGKKIILWIGAQGCGYCQSYAPIMEEIEELFGEEIYYLDLGKMFDSSTSPATLLDQEGYNILANFATDDENKDIMQEFGATPMTLVIKNNKIVGGWTGAGDKDVVSEYLKEEGFKQK